MKFYVLIFVGMLGLSTAAAQDSSQVKLQQLFDLRQFVYLLGDNHHPSAGMLILNADKNGALRLAGTTVSDSNGKTWDLGSCSGLQEFILNGHEVRYFWDAGDRHLQGLSLISAFVPEVDKLKWRGNLSNGAQVFRLELNINILSTFGGTNEGKVLLPVQSCYQAVGTATMFYSKPTKSEKVETVVGTAFGFVNGKLVLALRTDGGTYVLPDFPSKYANGRYWGSVSRYDNFPVLVKADNTH
jgi:hypothetical protein